MFDAYSLTIIRVHPLQLKRLSGPLTLKTAPPAMFNDHRTSSSNHSFIPTHSPEAHRDEKNNCFSIYTRSDLNKIGEETIQKYHLIDGSNHEKV